MSTLGKKTVEDIEVKGRNVLVRCDFNVPMKDGVITNDNRIVAALPTIKKLIENGGRVILCSHLGKPKNGPEEKFSLAPVAVRLSELLGKPVVFANDDNVAGENAKAAVAAMQDGDVVLLQNTRFRKEETKNLPEFSKDLADLVGTDGAYVNDAFGSAHRAHCSTAGVTDYIKDTAVGYLMEKEIRYLGNAVNDPVRPFVAILGGAKVADKLNVIENLLNKVDTLIIGGGMAYTFLAAKGCEVGKSLVDLEKVDYCKDMLKKAEEKGVSLLLPVDTTVASAFPDPIDAEIAVEVVDSDKIPADMMGLDIGPKTMELFAGAVKSAKTVVWNGPMGVFENPVLAAGTKAVAKALAETDATTVIGGGDSAAAVMQLGYADKMTHISTGGGAAWNTWRAKSCPASPASRAHKTLLQGRRESRLPLRFFSGGTPGNIFQNGEYTMNKAKRKAVIAGNWKMNKTATEAASLIDALVPAVQGAGCDVVICTPFTSLCTAVEKCAGTNIGVGAENVHFEKSGAFTGEISADMLVDLGVKYVITGHSERRQYFAETDETVNKRTKAALAAGLTVIVCVGESLAQREQGVTEELVRMQTKIALGGVSAEEMARVIIAYEPVWAIGTGRTATADQAQEVCAAIRKVVGELYGEAVAEATTIQYGGSMNAANADELLSKPDVDGGLIGGASLKPADFAAIVAAAGK